MEYVGFFNITNIIKNKVNSVLDDANEKAN